MVNKKFKYDYFWMNSTLRGSNRVRYGVAYAPKEYDSYEDSRLSGYKRALETFKGANEIPCSFELRDGGWADYLCNDMNYPLFSIKLKDLIENEVRVKLHTRWLKVYVKDPR